MQHICGCWIFPRAWEGGRGRRPYQGRLELAVRDTGLDDAMDHRLPCVHLLPHTGRECLVPAPKVHASTQMAVTWTPLPIPAASPEVARQGTILRERILALASRKGETSGQTAPSTERLPAGDSCYKPNTKRCWLACLLSVIERRLVASVPMKGMGRRLGSDAGKPRHGNRHQCVPEPCPAPIHVEPHRLTIESAR
jgi:hypothetical protein